MPNVSLDGKEQWNSADARISNALNEKIDGKVKEVFRRRAISRWIAFLVIAVATGAGDMGLTAAASGQGSGEAVPIFGIKIPPGYRDWKLISVAHEEGDLHSFAAVLGNDVAIAAYREGKLPFPDGTIIAALHYSHVASEENNNVFGRAQSFVPGPATNVQFMVKDSKRFAATGGWSFAHFDKEGKPGTEAALKTCFPCHAKAARDFVFTQYAQ